MKVLYFNENYHIVQKGFTPQLGYFCLQGEGMRISHRLKENFDICQFTLFLIFIRSCSSSTDIQYQTLALLNILQIEWGLSEFHFLRLNLLLYFKSVLLHSVMGLSIKNRNYHSKQPKELNNRVL